MKSFPEKPDLASEPNDAWSCLQAFTQARIALGRSGHAMPLDAVMQLKLAHAKARDAVHTALDVVDILSQLKQRGWAACGLRSAVESRHQYLTRPDLGSLLDSASMARLQKESRSGGCDVGIIVGDGLSARAIHDHAIPFLDALKPQLDSSGLVVGPVAVVEGARVAISDPVGEQLGVQVVVMLIGERPGLSASDSMGIYLTHGPQTGNTDEMRNCISNIRPGGLDYASAARKCAYLIESSLSLGYSGVRLKDNMPEHYLPFAGFNSRLDQ